MSAPADRPARNARFLAGTAPFGLYALAALVASFLVAALAVRSSSWSPSLVDIPAGLLLAAGFALCRSIAIEVDLRRDSVRVTLTEIPLALGLALLPGPVVIAAFAGVVLVSGALRRDSPAKLGLNVAVSTVSAATAVLIVGMAATLLGNVPAWLTVLIGVAVGHGVGSVMFLGAVVLRPGRRRLGATLQLIRNIYVAGVLNAVAAVAAFAVITNISWGLFLVVLLAAVLALLYWSYYGLLREQRDLELLNQVSLEVAGAGRCADESEQTPAASELAGALELVREQLNATRVVLHRQVSDAECQTLVAGEPLPRTMDRAASMKLLGDGYANSAGQVRRCSRATADRDVRHALDVRGASEVLVAGLRGADQLLGLIEVHDRQSRVRGFDEADLRLVETLASHLTTAMDNRRLLARLRHDAYHDTLTDLRNRLGFRESAAEVLRTHERCAVIVVDLDLLSSVNDALGHGWGDRIIVAAGQRLHDGQHGGLVTARLEGDTFAVLLADCDEEEAVRVAEQLRSALCAPYPVDRLEVESAARAGIALSEVEPPNDVDTLLQRADVALQGTGSGTAVRCYAPSMGQVFLRRFQLVTQFRQALDTEQVDVAFQPKLALATRQVIGVEALVRWHHPEFGVLDPEEFVAIVEATGLIDALTGFVLNRALAQCRAWLDRGLRLSVAVNLSVRNLADDGFPERVTAALASHGVPAALLGFELTESAVMSDPERALPVLRQLHTAGVHIAVDDFGTGYSSLAYLRRLPVDEVKIDKSFVLGMGSDLSDLAVVRAIVDLGHSLGLTVVAEGVEEDAARDQLVEMGCDVAQGYLISRPLHRERFEAWLRARTARTQGLRDEAVLTLL